MLRKIALYLIALIAIGIYLLAANPAFMRYYTTELTVSRNEAFRWNREKFGDLYSLSYLKDFKHELKRLDIEAKRVESTPKENDLYIIGDSYLAQLNAEAADSSYYRSTLAYYYYPNVEGGVPKTVKFENNGHKKILLFERTERFLRYEMRSKEGVERYTDMLHVEKADPVVPLVSPAQPQPVSSGPASNSVPPGPQTATEPGTWQQLKKDLKFHFDISIMNQNIETLLYGYGLFASIKETKASFNYKLFNRVNSAVVVAPDRYNLYIREIVDPANELSSFIPTSDKLVDTLAQNLDLIAKIYKEKGFDEVVFSFVPNAVSIGDPELGNYNDLLRRIQSRLRSPYIDVIGPFSSYPKGKQLYRVADTHWNATGYALWLDGVNAWLRKQDK